MQKTPGLILLLFTALLTAGCIQEAKEKKTRQEAMKIVKENFGRVDTAEVFLYTLTNKNGMLVKITNYGGIVTSIMVPGREGEFADVVLGFDSLQPYLDGHPYFGCIVGRYANRIAGGRFSLEGTEYRLAANDGPNHLHGGNKGFDKAVWESREKSTPDSASVMLRHVSPDGDEGYPGKLLARVTYTLTNQNELVITYRARSDKATPVNLTHHSYFNLGGGHEDALTHILSIAADSYLPVNEHLIPTGEMKEVKNTPMDFTSPYAVGERIAEVAGGYDHTYVLNGTGEMMKAAEVHEPKSGRFMEVFTTEPGIQFYSGNFLDGSITGKNGIVYKQHHGFCLETQHFPDSPNQPSFPNTILYPGEAYGYTTVYKFSVK
jgi:aldose 1-epimerase